MPDRIACQDCPLWKRSFSPGVGHQITGRCESDRHIRMATHCSAGMNLSWPTTIQDDWCDQHPRFDPANPPNDDEPFWPTVEAVRNDPVVPAQEYPLRGFKERKPRVGQGMLF